jgi:hypothetical protein
MPVTVKNDLKGKLNDNCNFHWINYDFYPVLRRYTLIISLSRYKRNRRSNENKDVTPSWYCLFRLLNDKSLFQESKKMSNSIAKRQKT